MTKLKTLSLVIATLFFFQTSYAQHSVISKIDFNVGIGLVPTFAKDEGIMKVPALSLDIDYRVAENFSLGLFSGYSVTQTDKQLLNDGKTAQWQNKFSVVGLRMAAHSNPYENWSFYGGLNVGYSTSRINALEGEMEKIAAHMGIKESSSRILMSGFVGTRLTIGKKMGIFGELGYGVSLLKTGVSIRI